MSASEKTKKNSKKTLHSVSRLSVSEDLEDTWICQVCNKSYASPDAKLLECQRCKHHFCIKCLKKPENEYKVLSNSDSMWFCGVCKSKVEENLAMEQLIKEKCEAIVHDFNERVSYLENEIKNKCTEQDVRRIICDELKGDDGDDRITKVANDITELKSNVNSEINNVGIEMQDKDRRKKNVIAYNIPEDEDEDGITDIETRRENDQLHVAELLSELGMHGMNITNLVRLGKRSLDRPRLLRLTVGEEKDRNKILSSSWKLKNSGKYEKVFLHPDLTPREREERKILVTELKNRKAHGEQNLVIVNGKIVTRTHNPFPRFIPFQIG